MRIGKLLSVAAAVILSAGMAMAATLATTSTKTKTSSTTTSMTTRHVMGTISSVSTSNLVLSRKMNGKTQNESFVLNSSTKEKGTPAKGDRATIYYHVSNNQNVATNVTITKT